MNYCSSCSSPLTTKIIDGHDRHVCSSCGRVAYENPLPTAGGFIVTDNKLLLVRRAVDPFKGEWDIPGGFVEKHEHPEEALIRELKEELSVETKIESLVGIFMGTYSDTEVSTLNIYYRVTIASGMPQAGSDVDAVEWFSLDDLPPIAFSQNHDAIPALKKTL